MSVVIDASVVVEYLLEPDRLLTTTPGVLFSQETLAPGLIDAEVGHVLRRRVRHGEVTAIIGARAVADLTRAPIERMPQIALLDRAWELRENVSFYDALYVALAERLRVPLLTFDKRLAGAPGLRCDVEVL